MGALDRPPSASLDRCWQPTGGDLADHAAVGQQLPAGLVVIAGVQVNRELPRQRADPAEGDPLVPAAAQRGRRTGVIGDAAVAAAKHQDLDELVENDAVREALAVAAKGMVDLAGGSSAAN
jgi:hypothetical protein